MRKRVLFVSLVLALLMTTLVPLPAIAKAEKATGAPVSFSGSGLIFVTYMPEPAVKNKIWRYEGEVVEGYFAQSDWAPMVGAQFYSVHDSIVNVDGEGNASGIMKGTFVITSADGSTMEGTFSGKISGNLYTGDISDKGIIWQSTGGTGVFAGVHAWGKWDADLSLGLIPGTGIPTLLGPITWEGKYK